MDNLTIIKTKLSQLPDEKALRERVLVPLFQKMKFGDVTLTHGSAEDGKDIVFYSEDETKERLYTAIVAKIGNISGGASRKASSKERTHLLDTILTQVRQAFSIPYCAVATKSKEHISRVWVVTNGTIKPAARRHIAEGLDSLLKVYLKFIEGDQLAELIQEHWPKFSSDIEPTLQTYFESLLARFGTLSDLKTLGYHGTKDLLDVFVTPFLLEEKPHPLTEEVRLGLRPPVEFIKHSLSDLLGMKRVWLDGPGGSGKTTLVRALVLEILAQNKLVPVGLKLPVVVEFSQISNSIRGGTADSESVLQHVRAETESLSRGLSGFDLEQEMRAGSVFLFLDGFDQITQPDERKNVFEALKLFANAYPNVTIICTSRDIDFSSIASLTEGFKKVSIISMNLKQVKIFFDKWFREKHSLSEKALSALRSGFSNGLLPKTPLVLTLLAILFDEKDIKEVPANLTELYAMFCELFLGRWDAARKIDSLFDYTLKDNLLTQIASEMQEARVESMSHNAMVHSIRTYLELRKLPHDPESLLKELLERSQIITKAGANSYRFRHLTFQHYFVSRRWNQEPHSEDKAIEKASDMWWRDVVFFYVGHRKESFDLVRRILEKPSPDVSAGLRKSLEVGYLLQAAYLTPHNQKVESVKFATINYVRALPEMISRMKADPFLKTLPVFMGLNFYKWIYENAYDSMTLKDALRDACRKLEAERPITSFKLFNQELEMLDSKHLELAVYLISFTLAKLGDRERFLALMKSAEHEQVLDILLSIDAAELEFDHGVKLDKPALNTLKRRLRRNAKALSEIMSKPLGRLAQKAMPY